MDLSDWMEFFFNILQRVALSITQKLNQNMRCTKIVVLVYFMDRRKKLIFPENSFINIDIWIIGIYGWNVKLRDRWQCKSKYGRFLGLQEIPVTSENFREWAHFNSEIYNKSFLLLNCLDIWWTLMIFIQVRSH